MSFAPMDDLLSGPVEELLSRIEVIANLDPKARVPDEEPAYRMGHSIGRVRGRPVCGSDLDIHARIASGNDHA